MSHRHRFLLEGDSPIEHETSRRLQSLLWPILTSSSFGGQALTGFAAGIGASCCCQPMLPLASMHLGQQVLARGFDRWRDPISASGIDQGADPTIHRVRSRFCSQTSDHRSPQSPSLPQPPPPSLATAPKSHGFSPKLSHNSKCEVPSCKPVSRNRPLFSSDAA